MIAGIGGCRLRSLARTFERYTPTYAYEFDHRTGPGLTQIPGYVWGAGHAAELAYIWPSFNNGTPIAPLFNADERRLAREMTRYWGAFTKTGRPAVARQTAWPGYHRGKGLMLSLRAGGRSALIDDDRVLDGTPVRVLGHDAGHTALLSRSGRRALPDPALRRRMSADVVA